MLGFNQTLANPDLFYFLHRVVSAVQAALSCVTGSIVCMWSCTRSFLHASHFMSEAYAWFGASYFFYDIWSMYRVHASISEHKKEQKSDAGHIVNVGIYLKEQPVIVMHHLFIGSFGFLIIVVSLLLFHSVCDIRMTKNWVFTLRIIIRSTCAEAWVTVSLVLYTLWS